MKHNVAYNKAGGWGGTELPLPHFVVWRKAQQVTVKGVEVAAGPAVLLQRLS